MHGIEKEIDTLGRVVIPKEFRKQLGLGENSKVLISSAGGIIFITPCSGCCALCAEKIEGNKKIRLCKKCISLVKSYE